MSKLTREEIARLLATAPTPEEIRPPTEWVNCAHCQYRMIRRGATCPKCYRARSHRDCYPEQYVHPLCGVQVLHNDRVRKIWTVRVMNDVFVAQFVGHGYGEPSAILSECLPADQELGQAASYFAADSPLGQDAVALPAGELLKFWAALKPQPTVPSRHLRLLLWGTELASWDARHGEPAEVVDEWTAPWKTGDEIHVRESGRDIVAVLEVVENPKPGQREGEWGWETIAKKTR